MSENPPRVGSRILLPFVTAALAGLFCVLAPLWPKTIAAQQKASVPDFTIDSKSAWLMAGDDFLPPPRGPGPVTFDKRYPNPRRPRGAAHLPGRTALC